MDQKTIKIITYVCIFIIILIILRFAYTYFNSSPEGFENVAQNLISKNTATDIQTSNTSDKPTEITWSNKLYNMQSTSIDQVKPIALYKPKLMINESQYLKLGDMLSQSAKYIPEPADFTVLIKKDTSEYKAPTKYELVAEVGNRNIDAEYYKYDKYISDLASFNEIYNSLLECSNIFSTINNLININKPVIDTAIANKVKMFDIEIGDVKYKINQIQSANDATVIPITTGTQIILPAGLGAILSYEDNANVKYTKDIVIPAALDSNQYDDATSVLSKLPSNLFTGLKAENIIQSNVSVKFFNTNTITYSVVKPILLNILNKMKDIYNKQYSNQTFLDYIKLADNVDKVNSAITAVNSKTDFDTLLADPSFTSTNPTILSNIKSILQNAQIKYNINFVKFTPSNLSLPSGIKNLTISLVSFNNLYTNNIAATEYTYNNTYSTGVVATADVNIKKIIQFRNAIDNKQLDFFPLKIYNPIAPPGFKSLGHVFCNVCTDIYQEKEQVACIPENCSKEMRDWLPSDKVYEYNKDGKYLAIYLNPYTRTFKAVSKNELPSGKVEKVIACVKKCTVVDDLIKSDDCARKYYNINNKIQNDSKLVSMAANDEEDKNYLAKIQRQSEKIAILKNKAQNMQLTLDKANIINREMNKNKLQNYVDTQKRNIELVVDQLLNDRNKIQVNVKIPIETINKILRMVRESKTLTEKQKTEIAKKIVDTQKKIDNKTMTDGEYKQAMSQVLQSCPEFDLTGLVRKDLVSEVCYGCDNPSPEA